MELHKPDRRVVQGHVALTAVQVVFGLFPVFGIMAFAAGGFSPLGVGAWRIVVGSMVLGGLALLRYGRRALPARKDVPLLFVAAMLGVAVNQGLFLVGLSRSTPMNAGLVMTLIPVFTFAIAALARLERFSALRFLGVVIALVSTLPLLFQDGLGNLGAYGLGNLLMVSNALCYSGYLVVSKVLTRRYSPLVLTAWAYILSIVALPLFVYGQKLAPDAGATAAWWSLTYILVGPTIIAYLLNMFALARVRASTTAVYVFSQPLISGIGSWVVFGEEPTIAMAWAAVGLFVGIWLVGRRPPAVQEVPAP